MREGLVVPVDGDDRLLEGSSEGPEVAALAEIGADFNVQYRFLHDRILYAAYALVEPEHKQELHLAIGRLLRRLHASAPREEDLLDVVRHLNLGAKRITEAAEPSDLARLNLRAGRRARAATAYNAAVDYFCASIDFLPGGDWKRDYDICFALRLEGAECSFLSVTSIARARCSAS